MQSTLDPIVALTVAAARATRLKLGSRLVIPGKNPVVLGPLPCDARPVFYELYIVVYDDSSADTVQ